MGNLKKKYKIKKSLYKMKFKKFKKISIKRKKIENSEEAKNSVPIVGLTTKEVEERIRRGQINIIPHPPSRTMWQIIRANLFTVFNALNFVLAAVVIIAGSPKNAIFSGVIITNTLIGIIQEVRAKKTIEKLSVLSAAKVNVVRDGKEIEIKPEELVKDDIMCLSVGQQLVADGEMLTIGDLEMDESMLTGESDPINKKPGEELLSGSFVVAGSGYAKVIRVGEDTYAAKLSTEARKFKLINSELQDSVNKLLKIIMWLIIPIGTLLVISQLVFSKKTWQDAAIGAVAGIMGMVPEGLVLLISATFVVGVIRLSKWKTLVQELPATEVLARVDTICLDKTGTLTEGKLKMVDVVSINDTSSDEIDEKIRAIANAFPKDNPTQVALAQNYEKEKDYEKVSDIPFSSSRKWSAVAYKELGGLILGAPEFILKERYDEIKSIVEEQGKKGRRVLLLATTEELNLTKSIPKDIKPIAIIAFEDIIRKEAPKTLKYFKEQGVNIKIISGDNPLTVSTVAKKAGVEGAENYVDARNLPEDRKEMYKVLKENSVFGRVTPHQKREMVRVLQENGSTVAMTGDGVNDVLALKEADCGIAMANASDATKAVAQLILLDSNFAALPEVVAEGRKMINNIERVSVLYLTKTIYSIVLSLIFGLILLPYPFSPIQLSLVGSLAIGIPSFFLALGENHELVRKGFLRRVLKITIPNGIIISGCTTAIFIMGYYINGATLEECRTLSVIVMGGISIGVLLRVSRPLNPLKLVLFLTMASLFAIAFVIPITRKIFSFTSIPLSLLKSAIILVVISVLIILIVSKVWGKKKSSVKDF